MINVISRLPVRFKILSSSVITLLLICLFIFTYYPAEQKKQLNSAMQQKDHSLAEIIALGVGAGMESSNFEIITEALKWAKRDSNLSFILVLDENYELFASYNPSKIKLDIPFLIMHDDVTTLNNKLYHIVKVPINYQGEKYGTLILTTSLEELYHNISRITLITLFISLAIFFFGLIISFFISNIVTKHLTSLRRAAGEIAIGNYDIDINVKSKDEIGVLGRTFNEMAKKLKLSINQLKNEIQEKKSRGHFTKGPSVAARHYRQFYCVYLCERYRRKVYVSEPSIRKALQY